MISISDNLLIGNSDDLAELGSPRPGAVLNVAQDLRGRHGWPDIEYMQVGLLDGPGNPPAAYVAAVLALAALIRRHDKVLVCCHSGTRSLAVVMMWMEAACSPHGWEGWRGLIEERAYRGMREPHPTHRKAFESIDWTTVGYLARRVQ